MKKIVLGIDVSKNKLDIAIIIDGQCSDQFVIENDYDHLSTCFKDLLKAYQCDIKDVLICAEYTGHYTYALECVATNLEIDLWVENPTEIILSSGLHRGKNDKVDALKIGMYAMRFQDKAKLYKPENEILKTVKSLQSLRNLLVADRAKYLGQLREEKKFTSTSIYNLKEGYLTTMIDGISIQIEDIEEKINLLIEEDQKLKRQKEILTSIDGVGEQTAIKMIVTTQGFTKFSEARKFCCHAGVAPFSYISGSSQRSKNRVSSRADKSIKTLLHMAAVSLTRSKSDLGLYYHRKVKEGKNKMTVLNAMRSKLVHIMFALIKKDELFQKNYVHPLA